MKKYYINLETLEIRPRKINIKKFILRRLPYLITIFSFSIILTAFLISYFPTPTEMKLLSKNQQYIHSFKQLNRKISRLNKQLSQIANDDNNVYRNIFGLANTSSLYLHAGIGGQVENEFNSDKIIKKTDLNLKLIAKQISIQASSFNELIQVINDKELMASSIPAILPLARKTIIRFSSPFGWRIHPIYHVLRFHEGIDITASRGTPVYATGDGLVVRADASAHGYGNHIRIAHGFGYVTLYAHLSKILVKPGQFVHRGDLIGLVGSTGLSTAPHLHYEVRFNGKPVNPVNFYYNDMTDKEYQMMIEQAKNANTHAFE